MQSNSSHSTKVNENIGVVTESDNLREGSSSPTRVQRKSIVSKEHLRPSEVHYPDGKKYVCRFEGCTYRTKYTFGLKRHIETRHAKEGEIIWHRCRYEGCDYKTRQRSNLGRHVKDHHEKDRRKDYICTEPGCKSSFKRSDHLSRHKKTVHFNLNKKRPYRTRAKKIADGEILPPEKMSTGKTAGAIPLYYNSMNADKSVHSNTVKSENSSPYFGSNHASIIRFDDISVQASKPNELQRDSSSDMKHRQFMNQYRYPPYHTFAQQHQDPQHRFALMQQHAHLQKQQQQQKHPQQRQYLPVAQHGPPTKPPQHYPNVYMDSSNTSHSGTNLSMVGNMPSQNMQHKEVMQNPSNPRFPNPNQQLSLDAMNRKREAALTPDELYASSRSSSQQSHPPFYRGYPQANTSPSLQPLPQPVPSKRPRVNDLTLNPTVPGHMSQLVPPPGSYPKYVGYSHPQQQKSIYPPGKVPPGMGMNNTRDAFDLDGSNPGMKRPGGGPELGRFNDARAYINKPPYEAVEQTARQQGMPRAPPVDPNAFRVRGMGEEREDPYSAAK